MVNSKVCRLLLGICFAAGDVDFSMKLHEDGFVTLSGA